MRCTLLCSMLLLGCHPPAGENHLSDGATPADAAVPTRDANRPMPDASSHDAYLPLNAHAALDGGPPLDGGDACRPDAPDCNDVRCWRTPACVARAVETRRPGLSRCGEVETVPASEVTAACASGVEPFDGAPTTCTDEVTVETEIRYFCDELGAIQMAWIAHDVDLGPGIYERSSPTYGTNTHFNDVGVYGRLASGPFISTGPGYFDYRHYGDGHDDHQLLISLVPMLRGDRLERLLDVRQDVYGIIYADGRPVRATPPTSMRLRVGAYVLTP